MLRTILSVALTLLLISACSAQKKYAYSVKSKKAIGHFEKALRHYDFKQHHSSEAELKFALRADPNFVEARTLLGDVYTDMKRYDDAAKNYKYAIKLKPHFFPRNYLNLARAQMKIHQFDSAKININAFLNFGRASEKDKLLCRDLIDDCDYGSVLVNNPVPFNPINLGRGVNSPSNEYHPSITVDEATLVYTRLSPKMYRDEFNRSKVQEDFYISRYDSVEWSMATELGPPINTKQNEGAQCLDPSGNAIYYTACNRMFNIGGGSCDIYYSKRVGNSWTKPFNLGEPVNSETWDSQPSIASDGVTLYFNSKRPGAKGGTDLWKSVRDKNGNWSRPENLGDAINSKGNEMSPFIHPDGKTLYFASDGHRGLGETDLFVSRMDSAGNWSEPRNLGYPINTASDEKSLIVSASGRTAYYASDREGGFGNLDLYKFELPEAIRATNVSYVKGVISDISSGNPISAICEIIDLRSGEIVAKSVSDINKGEYLVSLPTQGNYALNVSAKNYLFHSENFSFEDVTTEVEPKLLNVKLKPVRAGESIVLKNIFFATDSYELTSESTPELNKLVAFLNSNPSVKIEVSGHTDNTGSASHNQKLSKNRAKAVYDFLLSKSVSSVRISFAGYGSTKPIADNSTEQGRSINRRTEFKILSEN